MVVPNKRKSDRTPPYRKLINGTFEQIDVEAAIESARYANSIGKASDRDLFSVLLCSENPDYHEEALNIALRNNNTLWGRLGLFKMYYNGIGTERDVKTALYTLLSDNPIIKTKSGSAL